MMYNRIVLSSAIGVFLLVLFPDSLIAQETRKYGDVPAPKYDMIPMKKYDMVPMKQEMTTPPETAPSTPEVPGVAEPEPIAPGKIPNNPVVPQKQVGERFQGIYFHMDGRTLHKWDFLEDGTFLHQIVAGGGGTGVRNSERGEYVISGEEISLKVTRNATAFSTPGLEDRGRQTTLLGGGADDGGETRKVKFGFVGPKGAEGIILDGVTMKPRKWQ